ncbi:DNA repair protein RadC [Candidatus Cytomitobacter indipagum]|uniref:DNA repair protein RadC n=1 Tax=Candidatus Cytomitobacter indipagum TaxID=2601575 RepID=A0A5C0UDI5_9PROT|nr:DNA repair protein RadC [Candidatus Cytomitobacter indipagum]QEK37800.1 DNA repair protein RadC [Candidatus Cytomitobacter indipagum]
MDHKLGHRKRLRERFLESDHSKFSDYELIELLLQMAQPRKDVKPLAKDLMASFKSFSAVISASVDKLRQIKGMGQTSTTMFKIVHESLCRLLREDLCDNPILNTGDKVMDYCKSRMAYLDKEQFRVLFLNKKNVLILDEVQQKGTIDHAPIYPREVIQRSLELGASAIILVHNHPSGNPSPSNADITVTYQLRDIANMMEISLHDHLIISKGGCFSMKENNII